VIFSVLQRLLAGFIACWIVLSARAFSTVIIITPGSPFPDAAHHTFDTDYMIFNAVLGLIFTLVAWGSGVVLFLQPFRRWWNRASAWVILPSLSTAAVIILSEQLGLTSAHLDHDTGTVSVHELSFYTWAGLYLLTIFPIVHWPRKAADK